MVTSRAATDSKPLAKSSKPCRTSSARAGRSYPPGDCALGKRNPEKRPGGCPPGPTPPPTPALASGRNSELEADGKLEPARIEGSARLPHPSRSGSRFNVVARLFVEQVEDV